MRLINVNTGVGMKNCDVKLTLGDPGVRPPPPETRFLKTSVDDRARFSIAEPLPRLVWVYDDSYCAWPCGGSAVIPVDDILRTGVMSKMDGRNIRGERWCRPSQKKLEEITAKPGEIVIFTRKLSWLERLSLH